MTTNSPKCEMTEDCPHKVSHLDESGFVYCQEHGNQRKAVKRCRKLKPQELKKILAGEVLEKY